MSGNPNVYNLSLSSTNCAAAGTYYLKITGSSAANLNVQYSTSQTGPWTNWTGTGTYVTASGRAGTPSNPKAGDSLTLSGNFPLSTSSCVLSGGHTYVATGTSPGFTGLTAAAADADWSAPSN